MDCPQEFLDEIWIKKLYEETAMKLVEKVQDSKIRDALFSIHDDKALGPDGVSSFFFKKCWPIVSDDVKKAVEF